MSLKHRFWPGIAVHASDPSTLDTEVGESRVQSQPGLHSQTLSQKTKNACSLLGVSWPNIFFFFFVLDRIFLLSLCARESQHF